MHVVMVNPRAQRSHRRLPLSLLMLARTLPADRWELFDGNVQPDALERAEAAVAGDPQGTVLLVTVMPGPQLHVAVPWCRAVKRRHPAVRIVWGGYFPTVYTEACVRDAAVDLVVVGQGEQTLPELLEALASDRDPATVPGVALWRDGAVVRGPHRPIVRSSTFGDPAWERLDMELYAARTFLGRRTFNHHASVGCPWVCNFCAVTSAYGGRYLADPAEHVARIARRLHREYGADALELHDNNFFVSERRCADFARDIRPLGLRWWGEARIDTLLRWSTRTWSQLAASGLAMVFFGAESGDQDALDAMDKGGLQVRETLQLNRVARAHGILPEFSFVLGTPGDPEREVAHTLDLVRALKADNPDCEIILYTYTPVPLPGMYDRAIEGGFAFPETLDQWLAPPWSTYEQRRHATTPWLDPGLVRRVHDFESVLHARWPSISDRNLTARQRRALQTLASPRYLLGWYNMPWELKALQRLWRYRRPEEMGF